MLFVSTCDPQLRASYLRASSSIVKQNDIRQTNYRSQRNKKKQRSICAMCNLKTAEVEVLISVKKAYNCLEPVCKKKV